jgi:phenylacetaldehyde dehydrogenase
MAGWATKINGETITVSAPGSWHAYTLREPVGVVGQIIPWNFPLMMAAWKIAPALAAGCTIVLKPAEQTPLTALRLGQLIQEAGFPDGVVNILTGFGETAGAALAAHPDVDKVAFTGSTEVGKLIVQAAAGNLKKVSLELGGKSPAIVFPDADMDLAISGTSSAIFFNMGQCCTAGSRLYAHKRVFDQLMQGVADRAGQIRVGHGLDPQTQLGPLVSDEQFKRVTGYLDAGRQQGAKVVTGGSRVGDQGYFVQPTVLTETNPEMSVVREEIFGPVVCAIPFDDDDLDRIARTANDTSYGLAASIWTRDLGIAHKLARRIKAGTVWINTHNFGDPALPFGGYKQSGWGREMGYEAIELYTEVKRSSGVIAPLGPGARRAAACCAALRRLRDKACVCEALLCLHIDVRWKRPFLRRVDIALKVRRVDGADDSRIHVRMAEGETKNKLHGEWPIEKLVDLRSSPQRLRWSANTPRRTRHVSTGFTSRMKQSIESRSWLRSRLPWKLI